MPNLAVFQLYRGLSD